MPINFVSNQVVPFPGTTQAGAAQEVVHHHHLRARETSGARSARTLTGRQFQFYLLIIPVYSRAFPCCAEEEEDQEGNGLFGWVSCHLIVFRMIFIFPSRFLPLFCIQVLTSISMLIVLLTLPFSLCVCLKVKICCFRSQSIFRTLIIFIIYSFWLSRWCKSMKEPSSSGESLFKVKHMQNLLSKVDVQFRALSLKLLDFRI